MLPRSDLRSEGSCVIDMPVKTLAFEDANLNLGHILPTSSLRSIVELESIKIHFRLLRWEEIVESSRFVHIELIHHNPDAVCIRVVNIRQLNHPVNTLCRPSSLRNFDGYPASQRFGGDVESLFSAAFATVIDTSGSCSSPRSALLDSSKQMIGRASSYGSWFPCILDFKYTVTNSRCFDHIWGIFCINLFCTQKWNICYRI